MQTKTLGEICRPKQWKTVATSQLSEEGYPVYGANGIIGKYKEYNHENETILVTCRGATCGALNICEPFSYVNGNAMALDNLDQSIDLKYLYYFLKGRGFHDVISGSAQPQIIRSAIERIEVPICDIETQKEITKSFAKIEKLIESKKKILANLDNLVKARFVEMFNDSKTYPIKPLSDIAEYWNGLTYKPTDVSNDGTIVLRSSNIQNMQLDLNDIVRVKCDISNKKIVEKNDILMCSRNGSAKLVGKVALIPNLREQMSFGAFMMIIRSKYYPYLMTYFQLPEFRSQISTGTTTINQITRYMLDKVRLPVPDKASIDEFSTFVAQVDKSKFALGNELAMGNFYIRLIYDRIMHSRIDL